MPSSLLNVLPYIAIPVLIIIAGGSLSAFYSPASRLRSSIQHFAAGLVFAALIYLVAEELLVEAHDQHAPEDPLTIALFFAGVMLLISIEMSV